MKSLRPYQVEALDAVLSRIKKVEERLMVARAVIRILIAMATGLGKTVLVAQLTRWWCERQLGRVLFLMHMTDALIQARKEFEEALHGLGVTTGLLIGDTKENLGADVLFATFQSMGGRLEEISPDEFRLVIVDEAHHGHAESYRNVIGHFEPDVLYGMTATPDRMDKQDIRDIFGPEVYKFTLAQALADGRWLARVDYRVMVDNIAKGEIQKFLKRINSGDRGVTRREVDRTVFLREKLDAIALVIKEEQQGEKQTIIFCRSIGHVRQVQRRFPEAKSYHSGLPPDVLNARLEAFRSGELRTILVVDKFNEAIDIPDAELIVFLRATDSKTVWIQQLGRGLRRSNGKDKVVVLDFVANCRRLMDVQQFGWEIKTYAGRDTTEIETGWRVSFSAEAVDIIELLGRLSGDLYETWEEASEAAKRLNIKSEPEYKRRYKEDSRLPSNPNIKYSKVWAKRDKFRGFLGTSLYPTWEMAAEASRRLGVKSSVDYVRKRELDPHLPYEPKEVYFDVWSKNGDWAGFLNRPSLRKPNLYPTWEEASEAVQRLGIKSEPQYKRRYKEDPRLPSNPNIHFKDVWAKKGNWPPFLGKRVKNFYPTWEQASGAARSFGFRGQIEYKRSYKQDSRLPSNPNINYAGVWEKNGGWPGFLGKKGG